MKLPFVKTPSQIEAEAMLIPWWCCVGNAPLCRRRLFKLQARQRVLNNQRTLPTQSYRNLSLLRSMDRVLAQDSASPRRSRDQ